MSDLPEKRPISVYFHIPFCAHRCAYCDFNTYAGQEGMIPAYVDALCNEVELIGERLLTHEPYNPVTVGTIFFGGGTPSLLSPSQFDSILTAIRARFTLTADAEITMEANPGACSFHDLLALRSLGINRVSFGAQSANAEELRMLERVHDFFDVIEAVTSARKAGFDNLNLDLIYGLPEQTLQTWQTSVKRVLDLHPEHISAYALTLEHGTPFGRWAAKGLLPLPDPDLAAEMYEWTSEVFESKGYVQYEISNWAKANAEFGILHSEFMCRHNLQYWRSLPYLAFGAGAHGYTHGYRYSNVLRIKTYIDRLASQPVDTPQASNLPFPLSPAAVNHHKQTMQDDMSEFMMTGLRLTREGVSAGEFQSRFHTPLREAYGKEIEALLKLGLVEWREPGSAGENDASARMRLTSRARLLANQVFIRFV